VAGGAGLSGDCDRVATGFKGGGFPGAPSSVSPYGRATFSHEGRRGDCGSSVLSPPSPLVGEGPGVRGLLQYARCRGCRAFPRRHPSSDLRFAPATFSLKGKRGVCGLSALSPPSPLVGEGTGVRGLLRRGQCRGQLAGVAP